MIQERLFPFQNFHQLNFIKAKWIISCNNNCFLKNTILIGLQPRGVFLLDKLTEILLNKHGINNVNYGKLDITFFRDDFRRLDKQLTANFSKMNISGATLRKFIIFRSSSTFLVYV